MRRGKSSFKLARRQGVPTLQADPVDARHVGRRNDVLIFQKFTKALRPCAQWKHNVRVPASRIEARHGTRLAADSLVAYPEDQVIAPLHRLLNMRQGEGKDSHSFSIHGDQYALPGSDFLQPDRPAGTRGINDSAALGDDDSSSGHQPAGCGPRGLHQRLPPTFFSTGNMPRGLGRADGFARTAGLQQGQNRRFERRVHARQLRGTARV